MANKCSGRFSLDSHCENCKTRAKKKKKERTIQKQTGLIIQTELQNKPSALSNKYLWAGDRRAEANLTYCVHADDLKENLTPQNKPPIEFRLPVLRGGGCICFLFNRPSTFCTTKLDLLILAEIN